MVEGSSSQSNARSPDRLDRFLAAPKRAVWTMAAPMMAGMAVHTLLITGFRVLIVGIPLAYAVVLLLDAPIEAVWASALIGGMCSTVLSFWWVRRLVWKADPTARATIE